MDRKNEKNGSSRGKRPKPAILLTVLSLVLVVLAGTWFYAIFSSVSGEAQQAISVEAANILLQFIIIIVIGGLVTFAIGRFDKWRRGDKALQEYRREFIKNLTNAYHRAKRIRRELRAAGLSTKYIQTIPSMTPKRLEVLQEKTLLLNDIQLTIEGLIVEVGLIPDAFPHKSELIPKMHSMEKYLGKIVNDYEENWVSLQEQPPAKTFADLKNLSDFTGPHDETEFKDKFSAPFYEGLGLVRKELLPFRHVQS